MPASHTPKPINNTLRSLEKANDDSWITSGSFGTRDAVLVFRADILNHRERSSSTDPDSSTSFNENSQQFSDNTEPKISNCNLKENRSNSCDSIIDINLSKISSSKSDVISKSIKLDRSTSKSSILPEITNQNYNQTLASNSYIKHPRLNLKKNFPELSSRNSLTSQYESPFHPKRQPDINKYNSRYELDKGSFADYDMRRRSGSIRYHGCNEDIEDEESNSRFTEDDNEDRAYTQDMPALKLKIKYKFMQTETKLLRKIFSCHGLIEADGDDNYSILWTGVHMKPDILRNLAPYQRVNHFPRSYELTRKDRLYKNIERMQHLRGFRHFDIIPQSFILPMELRDLVSAHNKHRGPWIVKPAASSRGRGIFIVNTPDQIPQDEQVLVSKYIADPLCIDGHKCDLRVYVLVTSFDPLIIYLYEEGLVRLATVKYERSADSLWNPCMHLCNYSINKYHTDYIKSNDAHDEDVGHKWTLSALLRHLKLQGCNINQLMSNIEEVIIKSILSCAQSIISACRMFVPNGSNCFELYGFDILIDDTLKPWLLEINLSPSMGVDTPLDAKVKACLITDLLTCVGIPAFSSSMRSNYDTKWTRFRNVNCARRINSAEPFISTAGGSRRPITNGNGNAVNLTLEEQRIIRNAKLQNARRGGFVRIFPTESTMQRYGTFLDSGSGIPLSTSVATGQLFYSVISQHNYNQMLFNNLCGKDSPSQGGSENERMNQYERALNSSFSITFGTKKIEPKSVEQALRMRKYILKLIDNRSELTQLQARQTFAMYLDSILRRLTIDPRDLHEKLILKFLNRVGGSVKAPVFFRNPQNCRTVSKARSAMVAKLLCDFLEQYNRDTEAYIDTFDHYGMIPSSTFSKFLLHAQETDLEAVLTLHTNLTGVMPFLYNRCSLSIPPTPPIPSGMYGFLKAMPAMVLNGSAARDFNKHESYYRSDARHEKMSEMNSRSIKVLKRR